MSVWVYRQDEAGKVISSLVAPSRLHQHLEAGYVVDPDDFPPTFEEADTNNTGKLSVDEVRAAAKEAGIRNWHNKKISNLKKELGYV